jgi:hypothetical protein
VLAHLRAHVEDADALEAGEPDATMTAPTTSSSQ